jgi:putative Mg2+ transporter-C (MgtC) family protein
VETEIFRFSLEDELTMLARLFVAGIVGGAIGFERASTGHSAGIRTLSLVSLGAALFTLASIVGFEDADPARVAAQVATGVGFIGAGTIIVRGQNVQGLTTAASIWLAAALGMTAATGMYVVAVGAAIFTLVILALLPSRQPAPGEDQGGHDGQVSGG